MQAFDYLLKKKAKFT